MPPIRKVAAALIATGVLAGTAIADTKLTFTYKDGQNVEALYDSLEAQARRGCRSDSKLMAVKYREQAACRSAALDQIVRRIGNADLAALHRARTGHSEPVRQFASGS